MPLPGPVLTMSRPFSVIVLPATSASCTALRLAILALWRSASLSSIASIISPACGMPATMKNTLVAQSATRWLSRPCASRKRRPRDCPARCRGPPRWRRRTTVRAARQAPPRARTTARRGRARPAYGWRARASGSRPEPAVRRARRGSACARSSGASTVDQPARRGGRGGARCAPPSRRHRPGLWRCRSTARAAPWSSSRRACSCRSARRREGRSGLRLAGSGKAACARSAGWPRNRWPHQADDAAERHPEDQGSSP